MRPDGRTLRRDYRPAIEKILERLDKSTGCWLYLGGRDGQGYGIVYYREGDTLYAAKTHRVMCEHVHGPIPKGWVVMHSCDNPPCCNPAHLKAGTYRDNMMDAIEKGLHQGPRPVRSRS